MLTLGGMNGVVLVTDLFSLYVYIEIVAVSSFILISLYKDRNALESAFKYIVLSITAAVFILLAISVILLVSGDTSFAAIQASFSNPAGNVLMSLAACLFMCGVFTKGGLVPFHSWLPDAHSSAPTSISILLSGIVIKVSGIYPLIRLLSLAGGGNAAIKDILLFIGIISIFVGALAALGQSDMKRMLAFSSVSQMGYIVLSLGTGTVLGVIGAVFHLFNHAVFKSQLFANSAAVEKQTGTRDMNKLGGLGSLMPVTGGTSIVAMLSISGIPPLSGFWSKLIIIIALWQTGHYVYAVAAVIASVITLAYFLSLQRRVFFGKIAQGLENVKEAKTGLILPALSLALITVLIGLFFHVVLNKLIIPAGYILK
jgi:multicomponent Na+:H+ antiporter subunit D